MSSPQNQRFTSVLPWILFITVMVFFGIMPRVLLAPLLLRMSADLGISYDRASLFFLSSSAGFVTGLFSSGFVAQKLTHKWTIVASVLLAGIALVLLSRVTTVAGFHLLLFAGGWANGLYPGSGIAAVTTIAQDMHRGKALAVHECGPNLAFILAPVLAAAIAPAWGWRGVTLAVGAGAVFSAIAFAAFGHATAGRGQPPSFRNVAALARNRSFWVMSALFMVVFTAASGVYGVLPTYLIVEHGLTERFVNNLVGASRIAGFVSILSAGSLADRFGFRRVVTVILVVTGSVTLLLGIANGWLLVASVFMQPMIVGAFFPVGLSALADVTSPERRNLAIALAIPLANIVGAGLAPPLFTAAGARGWFPQAFIVLGIFVVASVLLLPIMGRPRETVIPADDPA